MIRDSHLLVVDDDPAQRELLAGFFRELGAKVGVAENGRAALEVVERELPDLVLTDGRMPELVGHQLLTEIKARNPDLEVILITAYGTVQEAVAALKEGAADYLLKPLDLDEVVQVVGRALERRQLRRENRELRQRLGEADTLPGIVTAGGGMDEVLSQVARVAATPIPVLITGESGTGKELLARAVHAASRRSEGPFVAVNAAALTPSLLESELFGHEKGAFTGASEARQGRFVQAQGGTLFLDEIGDLAIELQVKLLRVLQEKTVERVGSGKSIAVDVRIVAATHHDLLADVAAGSFREDLYYRLAVMTVHVPPLRQRRADVPLLVDHFRRLYVDGGGQHRSFSRKAMDILMSYDFPGNVRELRNIVERSLALARGGDVRASDLPPSVVSRSSTTPLATTLPEKVALLEHDAIRDALAEDDGNQSAAARRLGISERVLRYKIEKYGLR